jgi:RNA 2',3'-cyclic 3'-phosphodiesterase
MEPLDAAKHDVWRLFVAIELPDDVKQRALQIRRMLEAGGWHARWVRSEALHLSLRFYGNLRVDTVDELVEALRSTLAGETAFSLASSGPGVFPNRRRPRVIWLGVDDRTDALQRIAAKIEQQSRMLGIEPETRAFSPHVTLGRVRPEEVASLSEIERHFAEIDRLAPLPFLVDHVSLFRSDLRREGPIYTVVERFDLGAE